MNLYLAFGGFLIIAFLWAFILFGFLHTGFRTKKKSLLFILFFFIGLCAILVILGAAVEYMDSPEFCGKTCHPRADLIVHDSPMEPYYDSYKEPGNNSIMSIHEEEDVTCSNCHDKPGLGGKIEAYIKAIPEMLNYITGNYDPDDLGGHVSNENCLKCHDGGEAEEPGKVITFFNTTVDPHDDDKDCVDCHTPHQKGIGLTTEACGVCHGTNFDDFEDKLEAHGDTTDSKTDEDCMNCHGRKHPSNAYISFNEKPTLFNNDFCSDCHEPISIAFSKWSDTQKSIYGDSCTSCHSEHYEKEVPHSILEPYEDNCDNCHYSGAASHIVSDINFYNFTLKIDNEFCSDCHQNEYKVVSAWTNKQKSYYGDCTEFCHSDHKESQSPHITIAPYKENCDTCHLDSVVSHRLINISYSKFPSKINNEFCMDCHETEFNTLQLYNHSKRDCLDCHGEHNKIQVLNFDDCRACHSEGQVVSGKELNDIPSSHNEKRTGCGDCHNIDVIHKN